MTRLLRGFPALLTSLLVCLCLISPAGSGSMGLLGVGGPSGAAPTFQGPGDVVGSAIAWWGLRAYSASTRGTKAINLCDDTGANCADVLTDATTGKLNNPGTHGANNCSSSGTCRIKIFYDQSGALYCGSAACDLSQTSNPNRATLTWSCINSLPCAAFDAASSEGYNNAPTFTTGTITNLTFSAVANRTGAFTAAGEMLALGVNGTSTELEFRTIASAVQMYNGTTGQFISNITDSNYHTFQSVFNGASSVLFCGGSAGTACSTSGVSNSLSPGTAFPSAHATSSFFVGESPGLVFATMQWTEAGAWLVVFNGTQQTNMTSNQYTFWGPF